MATIISPSLCLVLRCLLAILKDGTMSFLKVRLAILALTFLLKVLAAVVAAACRTHVTRGRMHSRSTADEN